MCGTDERLTWLGHATVLLEVGGVRLLTDPLLGWRLGRLRRRAARPRPELVEAIDAALISHVDLDRLEVRSLRMLDRSVRVFAPRGARRALRRAGIVQVEELEPGDHETVGSAVVTAVPAMYDGRRRRFGAVAATLGYAISGAQRVYFAGDTQLFDGMGALAGQVDIALLPVWGWGPKLGPGHMDPLSAARAVALVRPRIAVPIHWSTCFPVGLDALRQAALVEPARRFALHVRSLAPDVEVRVLAPADELALERIAV